MKLSIILPAYNEESNIKKTVESVFDFIKNKGVESWEIIVVNDGSKDRTGDTVRDMTKSIPSLKLVEHFPNRGYGGALRAGFEASQMDWIFFMDSDGQFDIKEIELLMAQVDKGYDIVIGDRTNRNDPFIRKLNAFGWKVIITLFFGYLARDIDCAFKLFKRDILKKIKLESNGAMVSTEFLAGARARGYKISEVPVTHLSRIAGTPTGANIKVIMKAFKDLIAFKMRLIRELRKEKIQD